MDVNFDLQVSPTHTLLSVITEGDGIEFFLYNFLYINKSDLLTVVISVFFCHNDKRYHSTTLRRYLIVFPTIWTLFSHRSENPSLYCTTLPQLSHRIPNKTVIITFLIFTYEVPNFLNFQIYLLNRRSILMKFSPKFLPKIAVSKTHPYQIIPLTHEREKEYVCRGSLQTYQH